MLTIPTQAENPEGFHQKYRVEKLIGESDPNAVYLVLRLDGEDQWASTCRFAARAIAVQLMAQNNLPRVAMDIFKLCDELTQTRNQ